MKVKQIISTSPMSPYGSCVRSVTGKTTRGSTQDTLKRMFGRGRVRPQ